MSFQNDFFNKMAPFAQKAAASLNMPADVILGQWAVESDFGRSTIAQGNNEAGVTHVANSIDGGRAPYQSKTSGLWFAQYNNLDDFTNDYVRVMKLSYYDAVRAAVSSDDTLKALAASPYDAGHYGGNGASIKSMIDTYGLSKYNAPGTGGIETKQFSVDVPQGASQIVIGAAIIAAGLAIINAIKG